MHPSGSRWLVFCLVVSLILAAGVPAGVGADEYEPDEDGFDRTTYDVTVYANGSATWTFSYEHLLSSDEERSQFSSFADTFERESTPFYERRVTQAESITETGERVTGREMQARDFQREARIDHGINDFGVIEVSFVWDGFATTDGNDVIVHDVLAGHWLGDGQTLRITAGDDLTFVEAVPDASYTGGTLEDARAVSWDGERQFGDGEPYVRLTAGGDSLATWHVAAGVLVFAIVAGAGVALYRSRSSGSITIGRSSGGAGGATVTPSEEELLSDEDRVVRLIRENGGRMKQVDIVEETGWSKSKVSMLLSEMDEEGTISKLRVGRENIISLQGFEPEAAKSPHEN